MGQLSLDGREVDEVEVRKAHGAPLSPVQRQVLLRMRGGGGTIRTTEVGVMVHAARGHCGFGAKGGTQAGGIGCCAYAAPDGLSLLNRLMERGLVRRTDRRGVWELVT